MKDKIFLRKNIFTCVMFGAIFLFVLYGSFSSNIDLSVVAFFIAIPTFLLSFIKLIVDILEDINDKITKLLANIERNNSINNTLLYKIRLNNNIDEILKENSDEWLRKKLLEYKRARRIRKNVRRIRRLFLYIYYMIFMLMFVVLLLHSELATYVTDGILCKMDLNIFTIWSLIIVLSEIMMKDFVEDIIVYVIDKSMKINLSWY